MFMQCLIVCPLVFLAGFIDAIAGGGGLISLPAYMFTGIPAIHCVATNKLSSCMGTTIATGKYAKSGYIPWKLAAFSVPCAFLGSGIGANIALRLDERLFKTIMLVVLPLVAVYVFSKKEIKPSGEPHSQRLTILICMLSAFIIGIYDGLYGPGTGTFLILLFVGLGRMNLEQGNGLTKAINWTTNVSALAVYLLHGQVLLPLGLLAGVFNIAGNYLGASKFEKGGSKLVKPVMLLIIAIFFVKVLREVL